MRFHSLEHVPFEKPANIRSWAERQGHSFSQTEIFAQQSYPAIEEIDCLVVMGGPMGVYEEQKFPWLVEEKRYIESAIKHDKKVLGVCLGAQFLADVLGARVYPSGRKEIGWFPVQLTAEASRSKLFSFLPETLEVLHWHGDTYDLPQGAVHLARSERFEQQAFSYGENVLALQFHFELGLQHASAMVEHLAAELRAADGVQSAEEILQPVAAYLECQQYLEQLLEHFIGKN